MPRFACLNALGVLHHITFQNRYKSIVCREDTYLKDLARYIHLNPVRAGTVSDIGELNRHTIFRTQWIDGQIQEALARCGVRARPLWRNRS